METVIDWEKEYNDLLEKTKLTLSALCKDYRKKDPDNHCKYPMCSLCQEIAK